MRSSPSTRHSGAASKLLRGRALDVVVELRHNDVGHTHHNGHDDDRQKQRLHNDFHGLLSPLTFASANNREIPLKL